MLRMGRVGISKARPRGGKCDYCFQFDYHEEHVIERRIELLHTQSNGLAVKFVECWTASLQDNRIYNQGDFRRASSHIYMEDMLHFVHRRAVALNLLSDVTPILGSFKE